MKEKLYWIEKFNWFCSRPLSWITSPVIKKLQAENAELRALGSPTPPEEVYADYDKWIELDWSQRLAKSVNRNLELQKETMTEVYKLRSAIIEIEETYKREHPMHVSSETLTQIKEFT
jgi:hypothetical protein